MAEGAELAWAADQGPTVRFIGEVLAAIARTWGAQVAQPADARRELVELLPLAPWEALDRAGRERLPALFILRDSLPFNFR